jgi:hypothetical protein
MEDVVEQLSVLNDLTAKIYDYLEQGNTRLTRRRLLVIQTLLYFDTNTNAAFSLLQNKPPYLDGAEMILRSLYDLALNVDWVLKARTNVRLWRWLRDDRKTLQWQLEKLIALKLSHPKLNTKKDPLNIWQNALIKTNEELTYTSNNARVSTTENGLSLYAKVKTFSIKSQQLYHTMFWLFSTKTHASATGLQELVSLDPLHLKKRTDPISMSYTEHADKLSHIGLTWYAAQIYRVALYLNTPFVNQAKKLYEAQL